ncbi:MFS transporter [Streptacidiphilus sp. MAP12-33]|uniref:MFS transporter n=1 Tax=Streptacidiphilus sp. MAP12-33 TaxID=3156266 RepID=UPI003511C23A
MDLAAPRRRRPRPAPTPRGATGLGRAFRRFAYAQAASLTGSAMASVALAYAVLATGHGGGALGVVMAARILPLVLVLLVGGTAADRFGSRRVMLAADLLRTAAQACFALVVLCGVRGLGPMLVLAALAGIGEAGFGPGQSALVPGLVRPDVLVRANATLALLRSGAAVLGPVLAGAVLTTFGRSGPVPVGAAAVLFADAATFGVSVLALWGLVLPPPEPDAGGRPTFRAELRAGWAEFRARSWLWATTLHMAAFNLLLWGPYLVLGPLLVLRGVGGAGVWGAVMAAYGAGALLGAAVLRWWRPARPLSTAVLATALFAGAPAALALSAPLAAVCAGGVVSGVGSSVCGTLFASVNQRLVPPELRGRMAAFGAFGSFVAGPAGLAAAGPVSAAVGARTVLGVGVVWLLVSVGVLLTLPTIRRSRAA